MNLGFIQNVSNVTADERQPWTNYVNNGNEYLINGAVVHSEHLNIRLLVIPKSLFEVTKMVSMSRNHVSAASWNLVYFTL